MPLLLGHRFTGVDVTEQRALHGITADDLRSRLTGQTIIEIARRGKYLLVRISSGETLILHLKMSGVLSIRPSGEPPSKHTSAVFQLNGGVDLHFVDQRKFGSIRLVTDEASVTGKMGPEPLSAEFTTAALRNIVSWHRTPIKALLLDQSAIAGIGNMWADEALFAASVHPLKPANTLTGSEIDRLHGAIIAVLERGIRKNGASISTYRLPDGRTGDAQSEFRVAHRRGQECVACRTPLSRIKVRGRGTYYCPRCQPEES